MHLVMAGVTAPSHIYPGLAVIAELVSRGHRVSYLVGERLAGLVRPTGASPVTYTSALDESWPDDAGAAMQLFLDESMTALEPLLRMSDVDAVLYDIGGFAGRVAAANWGVPAVQLSPSMVAWEGYEEEMAEHTAALKASESGARYFAGLRAWLDANGVDMEAGAFLGRPDACVVLIPRVLQPNAERVSDRYVFAGPCIDESRMNGWSPRPGGQPLVYVSLGTAYTDRADIYRASIDQLADDFRLVLSTGKVDPAAFGGVDAARTQPQLDVLAHADVFVTHAGMGGSAESLWFGVPTVAIPQAVDQFANAAMLEAIGAGARLDDLDGLRGAVDDALGRTARARELQVEVRAAGGAVRAADAVERFIAASG
jgi:MGT family glycosyltransferase